MLIFSTGSVVVDVVTAYGPSFLSGVLYIGGGILSLTKYHPLCAPPLIGDLIPLFFSANSDDVSSAAEKFVDSCTAPGRPLPFSERLKWLGAFVLQPRTCGAITSPARSHTKSGSSKRAICRF